MTEGERMGVNGERTGSGPSRRRVLKSLGAAGVAAASAMLPGRASAAPAPRGAAGLDWGRTARVSKTTPTLQVVVNPLIRRGSPIHDNVFRELRALGADYVRFVPWYPYPRLGVPELEAPEAGETSWDFSLIDPMVDDFMRATSGHSTIMNFSTTPQWMWQSPWSVQDGQLYVNGGNNGSAKQGETWTDYTFAADVTPLASATHGGKPYAQAGLLFRLDESGNGYGFLLSNYPYSSPAASGYVVFVTVANGSGHAVNSTPLPFAVTGGQTYQVQIVVSKDTFTISVDGTVVDTATDSARTAGTIGFRENGAESARFDNVLVTAPDGTVLLSDDFSAGLAQWSPPGTLPADPDAVDFGYSGGTALAVPVQTVADYYRRLVSWYTAGGFTDEYGHSHHSGHHYPFPYWEVLNELEHSLTPELYTELYDAIVTEIRKVAPHTKFVGLAQATPGNTEYFEYFLDSANHRPGVPIDMVSYHFYGRITDDGQNPDNYGGVGFPQADSFLSVVDEIEAVRTKLAPSVRTTVDETGTIMNAAETQADPAPIPDAYWNFSGAIYAYVFAELALRGIDVVGESQLVGYPSQYPSVSMVDWNTGLPNARYRVLQLLLEEFPTGAELVPASEDVDSYYLLGLRIRGGRKVLAVNKTDADVTIPLGRVHGATARVVDQASGGGPIRTEQIRGDAYRLGGYGVAVLLLDRAAVVPPANE